MLGVVLWGTTWVGGPTSPSVGAVLFFDDGSAYLLSELTTKTSLFFLGVQQVLWVAFGGVSSKRKTSRAPILSCTGGAELGLDRDWKRLGTVLASAAHSKGGCELGCEGLQIVLH